MKQIMMIVLCCVLMLTTVGCGEDTPKTEETAATAVTTTTAVLTGEAANGDDTPSALTTVITTDAETDPTAEMSRAEMTEATTAKTAAVTTITPTKPTNAPTTVAKPPVTTQTSAPSKPATLIIRDASDADIADADKEYHLTESTYACPVYLQADGRLKNVRILELEVSFDDGMYDVVEERASLDNMADGDNAVVWLDFPGDFSAWGVSYTTFSGEKAEYTLSISGMDGSLVVQEGIV